MTVDKKVTGDKAVLYLEGRLDTNTAPMFEKAVNECIGEVKNLTVDFENLEYVSSAGLRVLLSAQKSFEKSGELILVNVRPEIMEVLDITGFSNILDVR